MKSKKHKTIQRLINGDARNLWFLDDGSVHLIVTSPPYWNLKRYNENPDQLGHISDYELFLGELEKVWREAFRVLVPGGRLVCVVGDVCVSSITELLTFVYNFCFAMLADSSSRSWIEEHTILVFLTNMCILIQVCQS